MTIAHGKITLSELNEILSKLPVNIPPPRTILFVDDERDQLLVIEKLLENFCEVITADRGEEALNILKSRSVDVIVADQRMPEITGIELLEKVKTLYPSIVRIILTAYSDTDVIIDSINRCNVFKFLLKPWNPEILMHTLKLAFEHKYITTGIYILVDELMKKKIEIENVLRELKESQEKILHTERLAVIGRFAAQIAHELRNELFILKGSISTLNEMKLDENIRQIIELEASSIENICSLATTICEYAKAQQFGLEISLVDINQLIEEVITLMKWRHDFKVVSWVFNRENIPPWTVDRLKIKQVLCNLALNGAEAIEGAKGTVCMSARLLNENTLQIEIKDSGKGIPDELAQNVWKPFFSTKKNRGLGIGLDICRQIIVMHGGKIYFKSTKGMGTSFYIEIPYLKKL